MSEFEREIHALWKNRNSIDRVADELIKKWHLGELSNKEQETLIAFLFRGNFTSSLVSEFIWQLEKNNKIYWFQLMELIGTVTKNKAIEIPKAIFDAIFLGSTEADTLQELSQTRQFDATEPRFAKIRRSLASEKPQRTLKAKKAILDQLDILRNERLVDEEKDFFEKILKTWKEDPEIQERFDDFQEILAKQLFQKKKPSSRLARPKSEKKSKQSEESFTKPLLKLAKKTPSHASMIAISLFFSGLYDAALQALELSNELEKRDWLQLEILLAKEDFLSAYDLAISLEKVYENDPELLFSSLYYQAICLYHLGKKQMAVAILEEIVKHRPDFRMAPDLLKDWSR